METTDLSDLEPQRWRRIIGLVIALIVVAVGALFAYRTFLSGGSASEEAYQAYTVGTMTLRAQILSSGTAESQDEAILSFSIPGQIDEIYVELGDEVKFDQPLISIKADALENALSTAESNLSGAGLRLRKLQEEATAAELAAAGEAVSAAMTALVKAQNQLQDALDPPTDAELAAAQQAVESAQAALSSAESKLNTLKNGASDADLAAAEAAIVQAENNLDQAERAEDTADDNEDNARSAFELAAERYCDIDGCLEDICADLEANNYEDPLTSDQVDALTEAISPESTPTPTPGPSPTPTPTNTPASPTPTRTPRPTAEPYTGLEVATANLIYASSTYSSAIAAVDNAEEAVESAEAALTAAEAALDDLEEGASADDIAAAEAAVVSAFAALEASQASMQELLDGASDTTIANLRSDVAKAQASLQAGVAAYDDLIAGATSTDIALQKEEVRQAELAVEKARDALDEATLTSPFDGTVAALPVKLGQFVTSAIPAVTVLTPGALVFELNIGETELSDLKVGQTGGLVFDAIQGKAYPIRVAAIGLAPDVQQGVIIYPVKCEILGGLDDESGPQPAPGMNGSASITTDLKADVVAIPSSAVRRRGGEQVVEVIVDGDIEVRPVETGLTDGENVEIVSGLSVGETIALRGVDSEGEESEQSEEELPVGIR